MNTSTIKYQLERIKSFFKKAKKYLYIQFDITDTGVLVRFIRRELGPSIKGHERVVYKTLLYNSIDNNKVDAPELTTYRAALKNKEVINNVRLTRQCLDKLYPTLSAIAGIQPLSDPMGMSFQMVSKFDNENALGFEIINHVCTAESRALNAMCPIETVQDLKTILGAETTKAIDNMFCAAIEEEMLAEVVGKLRTVATPAHCSVKDVSCVNSISAYIANDTRRGRGNFIIVNSLSVDKLYAILGTERFYEIIPIDDRFGILEEDQILIGYKGTIAYDAPIFYNPYVLLKPFRTIDANTFQPLIKYKTRFDLHLHPDARKYITLAKLETKGEDNDH